MNATFRHGTVRLTVYETEGRERDEIVCSCKLSFLDHRVLCQNTDFAGELK